VKELGLLKKVSTHFSLKSRFNCISFTIAFLLTRFLIFNFWLKKVRSGPEILTKDIAPLPKGDEHAIIVSDIFCTI